jgi:hypothetical protein
MSDKYIPTNPGQSYYGLKRGESTDLYRAKYGLPLDGESHERFIATKVPYRKNKDYRQRFRNYSFGYPVNFFNLDLQKRQLHSTLVQSSGHIQFRCQSHQIR